jgi:hypothetical protein
VLQTSAGENWCNNHTEESIEIKNMHFFGILKKLFNVHECMGWKTLKQKYKIFRLNKTVYFLRKSNTFFR